MLVKYTYPVSGDIHLLDHWPISWDKYRVTWKIKGDRVESVTVSVQTTDQSAMPQVTPNPAPGVAADINIGHQPFKDQVESILRTAAGLLNFFAKAEIDFDRPTLSWEAETDEERTKLRMFSFTKGPNKTIEPHPISFEMVARCFMAAIPASDQEIPLSFMTKGRREMHAGRFIDAYYSYFFFFETQFAPGYSNPKKVAEKLKGTPEIRNAFAQTRVLTRDDIRHIPKMAALLAKNDEDLIDHFVEVRGTLHHHALPRNTGSWHPEKHDEFEAETTFLAMLAHVVSQTRTLPVMYSNEVTQQVIDGAKREGAEILYLVEGEGNVEGGPLPSLRINVPSTRLSHLGLETIENGIRSEQSPYGKGIVREYTVKSGDGDQVLAEYKNYTFPGASKKP